LKRERERIGGALDAKDGSEYRQGGWVRSRRVE